MAAILFDVTVKAYVQLVLIEKIDENNCYEYLFKKAKEIFIKYSVYLYSTHNTVFKTLTEAVRESEIRKHDPSLVLKESRSS